MNVNKIAFTVSIYNTMDHMHMNWNSSVISVRIKNDLEHKSDRLGIKIRSALKKALREELEKRRREKFNDVSEEYSNA